MDHTTRRTQQSEKNEEQIAKNILLRMVASYPGLLFDDEVSGADLVEWVSNEIFALKDTELGRELEDWATHGSPPECEHCGKEYRPMAPYDRFCSDGCEDLASEGGEIAAALAR